MLRFTQKNKFSHLIILLSSILILTTNLRVSAITFDEKLDINTGIIDSLGNLTTEGRSIEINGTIDRLDNLHVLCYTTQTNDFDPCLRVESLFTDVSIIRSESTFPTDLSPFDVIYIGYGEGNSLNSHSNQFAYYINNGGGLIFTQPNEVGEIGVFPDGFEMTVSDFAWPDYPDQNYSQLEFTNAGLLHPILDGLLPVDLSGNFDTVPISTLGPKWEILATHSDYSIVSLTVGHYGLGRIVFHTGNINSYSADPGSNVYIQRMISWAGSSDPSNYVLSGRIIDEFGVGLDSITVNINSAESITTDSQGYYSISLPSGLYKLTPTKSSYFFTPPYLEISLVKDTEINFTRYPCIAPSGLNVCVLEPGDILLSRSPTYATPFSIGGTYFTHAAMYIGELPEPGGADDTAKPRLVEAQGNFVDDSIEVWETDLVSNSFWTGEHIIDWSVVRPNVKESTTAEAIDFIRKKAAEEGVIFNIFADRNSTKEYYCSKLVWHSYLNTHEAVNLENNVGLNSNILNYWVTPDDLYFAILDDAQLVDYLLGVEELYKTIILSPAHLTLVNPEGLRTGYDQTTGSVINEIPNATYVAPPDSEVETISAVGVGEGWRLIVTGYDYGDYIIESSYLTPGTINIVKYGNTEPGQVDEYELENPKYGIFLPVLLR